MSFGRGEMARKEKIFERYRRSADGQFVIDVSAGKIEDLYDDFDREAPYIVKELEANLVEYITESARELGKQPFRIHFSLERTPGEAVKERTRASLRNYFLYLRDIQLRGLRRTLRTSLIFLVIGLAIMFASVWVNQDINQATPVVEKVFATGLTVASWVAMWEAVANFLINWRPYRNDMKLYQRLAQAEVEFRD